MLKTADWEVLLTASDLDGLADKLRTTLQITHEDGLKLDTPLIDQGVDSLSAVTIGTW